MPTDDSYLINREDFRNVPTWEQNGGIYGALLDSNGTVLVNDIPMIDDFGTADEGDQRLNHIAYNPDKNEFFVCWADTAPSLNTIAVRGRFITSDGMVAGPVFTVVDTAAPQIFPHPIQVPTKKLYFVLWEDGRNAEDPNADGSTIDDLDIYGSWMSSNGTLLGSEIIFCKEP